MDSSPHYAALLAGRRTWPCVCHRQPFSCANCMAAIAQFLAAEMGWDLEVALDRPASWYQEDVFSDPEIGHELRRLTVQACFLHEPSFGEFRRGTGAEDIIVADDLTPAHERTPQLEVAA